MGIKLSPEELALYRGVDTILWEDWDPIGVRDVEAWARDEYYGYLPAIFALVKQGSSANEIASHLRSIANDWMGFTSSAEDHLPAARKLYALGCSGMI